jgi:hypothetical protein
MAKLVYSAIASLDGYVADEQGDFGWSMRLLDQNTFTNGTIYLRYGVGPSK